MYGREMTWGLMDVLAQCYNVSNIPSEYPGRQYKEGAAFYDYEYTIFINCLRQFGKKDIML